MFKRYYFILILFLSSCAMNKLFYQPYKMPAKTTHIVLKKSKSDSVHVNFTGSTHQPAFLINNSDTISYPYTVESVLFKSMDGNILNGWMLKPRNGTIQGTILHLHGNGGMLLSQYEAIAPLTQYGYQIFMFDYSGYGFSSGKPTRANVLADAQAALAYVLSRKDVQANEILLYGQSLGGHLAAVLAAQQQKSIQGLVLEGAFSSHKDVAQHFAGKFGRAFVKDGYSAKVALKSYTKPLLVIHSINDKTIPYAMGETLFQVANKPKYFYSVEGEHIHAVIDHADSIAYKIQIMLAK